jgi:ATP-dependent DNA helicase RecG
MTADDLRVLVLELRSRATELESVEVKSAHGGTPRRIYEALSSFANRTGGGVILFGLDEEHGFELVGVGNAHRLQEELTHVAADQMAPPLRPEFVVDEIDGAIVVAAVVDEVPAAQKPCFFKQAGLPKGAYLRVGNTNRQMTEYEVFGYLSGRGQPTLDEEAVPAATEADLAADEVDGYLARLRRDRPRARYLVGDRAEALTRLKILTRDGAELRPTLAGLLAFGKYPQEFFPQLRVTFVHYYGTTEDEPAPSGARFFDNREFEGPIPEMVDEAERYVLGAMRKAALVDGLLRRDIPEYPLEALREAIANAVAHRDYSPYVRGGYIQIRMFADRLEIQSPGGLFGNVTLENLEEEHSTRNARLMRILEDLHIVENRGSGIQAMIRSLRDANLEPPRFDDRRASFLVTFRNHTLLSPEAITWLNRFAHRPLNDRQRVTLVYLRQHGDISNPEYRRLNRVDALTAGQQLKGLVEEGLVTQHGAGRWTTYGLNVPEEAPGPREEQPPTDEERILAHVRAHGSISNAQCRELLGENARRATYLLTKLLREKALVREGERRWAQYRLP